MLYALSIKHQSYNMANNLEEIFAKRRLSNERHDGVVPPCTPLGTNPNEFTKGQMERVARENALLEAKLLEYETQLLDTETQNKQLRQLVSKQRGILQGLQHDMAEPNTSPVRYSYGDSENVSRFDASLAQHLPPLQYSSNESVTGASSGTPNEKINVSTPSYPGEDATALSSMETPSSISTQSSNSSQRMVSNNWKIKHKTTHFKLTEKESENKAIFSLRTVSYTGQAGFQRSAPENITLKVLSNRLPSVYVCVSQTTMTSVGLPKRTGSDKSEPLVAIFSVRDRDTNEELWRLAKDYSALADLEANTRPEMCQYYLPKMPDKNLFNSAVPVKVDSRREGLDNYFDVLLSISRLPLRVSDYVCYFLTTDVIRHDDIQMFKGSIKEGFLVKRGRGLGGWKARFFSLSGPFLNYYESPIGKCNGTISIYKAKVEPVDLNGIDELELLEYRHAFLIKEYKKKGDNSHILCAETDQQRDEWVAALRAIVGLEPYCIRGDPTGVSLNNVSSVESGCSSQPPGSAYSGSTSDMDEPGSAVSDGVNARSNRRRLFFRKKRQGTNDYQSPGTDYDGTIGRPIAQQLFSSSSDSDSSTDEAENGVFGVPLSRALHLASKDISGKVVPAIVFRCIELLSEKQALCEEGIFRSNGAMTSIKRLRRCFDMDHDLSLIDSNEDIHVVTGLLKLYLRELPGGSILPQDLVEEATRLKDLEAEQRREGLRQAVQKLPKENFDLLSVLCTFLSEIVRYSDVNKMTSRNMGIVFWPTLNLPIQIVVDLLDNVDLMFRQ
uniref:ARAD1D05346p n=1 Tax=Blastobotrys adeninivorans TaxID=409370 RepID=A0A060TE73_BLAAD